MPIVLTINVGGSSVKVDLWRAGNRGGEPARIKTIKATRKDGTEAVLREVLAAEPAPVRTIAHRFVHGGGRFNAPVALGEPEMRAIEDLSELAPLHNPAALEWVRACRELVPDAAQIALFDTAFFADLPIEAVTYALPRALSKAHGLRRYGFHGLAHEALWRRFSELTPDLPEGGRLVTLQLGSGCSAAAIARGRPVDTSMGFSPLEGLVMATRSGDLDPGVLLHLGRAQTMSPDELARVVGHESGLLGLGGHESAGDLATKYQSDDRAKLALDVYVHRIVRYVGAFTAVLGGIDGLVFGGGVGENVPFVRAQVIERLGWAGFKLDRTANDSARGETCLTDKGTRPAAFVVAVDESRVMLDKTLTFLP